MRNNCPKCSSNRVVPIVYGYPIPETFEEAEQGKIKLGGCVVSEHSPRWHCGSCGHEWR